ncbi:MAG: cobalamin-binding protein [Candidatus Dormibacteraeota bacterium]|nr:cobalamin-binding protein [Candidatus Dormibacteraeota bacterium]
MARPGRIASLLPSATELLFAVGAGERVVAVTHECDHPSQTARLPRVTSNALPTENAAARDIDTHIRTARHAGSSIYNLDAGLLAELGPDLILTQELCEVCAVAYETVARAARRLPGDVPIVSLEPRTLDDIVETALAVGAATGDLEGAQALSATMRERIDLVASMRAPEPRPRVACIEWTDPIFIGGHWVPEMVSIAGGDDPLGVPAEPSVDIEWERVLAAEPDVMVLMPCGFGLRRTLELATGVTERPGFSKMPCARSGRVVAVDGSSYFNRPGPRIVDGLDILAAAVRSEPGDPLPTGAAWVAC